MSETDAVLVDRDGPVTVVSDADPDASVAVFTGTGDRFGAGANRH
jgi:enoyl-CoA hydratase/carnithine racemase